MREAACLWTHPRTTTRCGHYARTYKQPQAARMQVNLLTFLSEARCLSIIVIGMRSRPVKDRAYYDLKCGKNSKHLGLEIGLDPVQDWRKRRQQPTPLGDSSLQSDVTRMLDRGDCPFPFWQVPSPPLDICTVCPRG